jgi:hypothetical protein
LSSQGPGTNARGRRRLPRGGSCPGSHPQDRTVCPTGLPSSRPRVPLPPEGGRTSGGRSSDRPIE